MNDLFDFVSNLIDHSVNKIDFKYPMLINRMPNYYIQIF